MKPKERVYPKQPTEEASSRMAIIRLLEKHNIMHYIEGDTVRIEGVGFVSYEIKKEGKGLMLITLCGLYKNVATIFSFKKVKFNKERSGSIAFFFDDAMLFVKVAIDKINERIKKYNIPNVKGFLPRQNIKGFSVRLQASLYCNEARTLGACKLDPYESKECGKCLFRKINLTNEWHKKRTGK